MPGEPRYYDVIVVGAGPTGLAAASFLVKAGHSVALFERHASLYNLPRAGHIDEDVLRLLQDIHCLDAVLEDFVPFLHVPLLGCDGTPLFDLVQRHESRSSFRSGSLYQPVLEEALCANLRRQDQLARVYLGWLVTGAHQEGELVRVHAQREELRGAGLDGAGAGEAQFDCRYLIAADGAASTIRHALGIEREDYGCNERWLDVDVAYRRSRDYGPPTISGDPRRPHLTMPLGKRHHRFEWQLFPDESSEKFAEPHAAWKLLGAQGVTAEDVEIVRQAAYTFEYRLAQRWRIDNIFLMGDAAHTMPPCLGQGMCSGIRDAANLAWKLDLVLRGSAGESILDSYQVERYSNVKAWSDLSQHAGEILCLTDPVRAAARDARFREGAVPTWQPPAALTCGFLDGQPTGPGLSGQLLPQRRVRRNGAAGLSDDVLGGGFLLLSRADPRPFLSSADLALESRIGMSCAWFAREAHDSLTVEDATGEFERFFVEHDQAAVIVRPDHFLFGGVQRLEHLPGLIARFRRALASPSAHF